MSYYEDFGLPPNASPEQIREAYKLLVRLLHPDQQTDPALKWAAEGQMRRINRAYAVLSDPERRRQYDVSLISPPDRPAPLVIRAPTPVALHTRFQTAPLLWIAAAIFSLGAIIFLATQGQLSQGQSRLIGTAAPDPRPPEQVNQSQSPLAQARPAPPPPATIQPEQTQQPPREPVRTEEPEHVPSATAAPSMETHPAVSQPAPTPPQVPAPELTRVPGNHFGGFWAYPHEKNFQRQSGQYPPQFIEATITEHDGLIHGKYRARYYVSDRPISPNVNFEFEGKPEGGTARIAWHGEGGSLGIIDLKLISAEEMELIWRATDFGQVLGLGSGTAILMRRPD